MLLTTFGYGFKIAPTSSSHSSILPVPVPKRGPMSPKELTECELNESELNPLELDELKLPEEDESSPILKPFDAQKNSQCNEYTHIGLLKLTKNKHMNGQFFVLRFLCIIV